MGCQLDLVVKDGRIVDAEGAPGPSNKGLLCVKGRSGSFDFVDAPEDVYKRQAYFNSQVVMCYLGEGCI